MQDEPYQVLGRLDGVKIGVQHVANGQHILIQHTALGLGQRLACLLAVGKGDIVRREDGYYWRIPHDQQVDDLLVELIDVLISIRYAHPAMVQLEMVLEPAEP